MNTVTDECCIIDVLHGIDTASPQISQFTDNFTKIKFIIGKNLKDYTVMILTDIGGQVEFVIPNGTDLIKTNYPETNETTLLWSIGREITAQSGVITYQIVAYKGSSDNIEATWYSKEGRLKVTESIDSATRSAAVMGSYPDLVTKLILEIEKNKEDTQMLSESKVDKVDGMGLSQENFTALFKEKLEGIEEGAQKNVCPDWKETDSSKDSYILSKPSNFASILAVDEDMTTFEFKGDDIPLALVKGEGIEFDVANRPEQRSISISSIIDKVYNPESNLPQSGKAVAQAIAALGATIKTISGDDVSIDELTSPDDTGIYLVDSFPQGHSYYLIVLNRNVSITMCFQYRFDHLGAEYRTKKMPQDEWSEWKSVGVTSYNDLTDKPQLADVATSGNYDDLTNKPEIPESVTVDTIFNPDSQNAQSGTAVYDALDQFATNLADVAKSGSYNDLTDKPQLKTVATTGNYYDLTERPMLSYISQTGDYNDLKNMPVTMLKNYPSDLEMDEMLYGAYFYIDKDNDSLYLFASFNRDSNNWAVVDGNINYKYEIYTQVIIDADGIRRRQRRYCFNFDDKREPDYTDWEWIVLNEDTATTKYVDSAIAKLVDSAPETLDTLNEIAEALGNDQNFATTIINTLGEKANSSDLSKVATSGSYNDLTDKPNIDALTEEITIEKGNSNETMTLIEEIRTNTEGTYENIYIGSTGNENANTNYALFDYMEFNPSKEKLFFYFSNAITSSFPRIVCYDENKSFSSCVGFAEGTAYSDEYTYDDETYMGHMYDIPENTAYIRVNMATGRLNAASYMYIISEHTSNPTVYIPNLVIDKPFKGMNILNLGDSIFGNDRKRNISQYLAEYSGATVYNGGFGGTRMTIRTGGDAGSGYEYFDGVNLVTALTTGDWTNQDAGVELVTTTYYAETLEMLKNLDMSTVDIITIAWGTNDYTAKKTIDEITTSLESIIDMIQSAYPTIRILVCTPIWRYFDEGDSDTKIYNISTLKDIALAIEETAKNKRVSVLNGYQNLPLSMNTASTYFDANDKTHLNEKGNALYAHLINGKLNSIF